MFGSARLIKLRIATTIATIKIHLSTLLNMVCSTPSFIAHALKAKAAIITVKKILNSLNRAGCLKLFMSGNT